MKAVILAALALAARCVSSQELTRCGTTDAPQVLAFEAEDDEGIETRSSRKARFNIDTYVHVITTEAKKDRYPLSMIQEQVNRSPIEGYCHENPR
jgi:hypothetical protein